MNDNGPRISQPALSEAEALLADKPPRSHSESALRQLQQEITALSGSMQTAQSTAEFGDIQLQWAKKVLAASGHLLDLGNNSEAAEQTRPLPPVFIEHQHFEHAATAMQYIYLAGEDDALESIGQAAWLAVTYPVDPALTVTVLEHIVDETPDNSDGAAVAAATAHYVAGMRADSTQEEELKLFTAGLLAKVARRHSKVETQAGFEAWVERLELDQPDKFLVRLRNIIDVLVQDAWQFDREALVDALPEEPGETDDA